MQPSRAWIHGVVAVASLGTFAPVAHAQDVNLAVRRELLEQAQRAHDAGDHAHALDFAIRASRIQMTPSLRMFIAEEQSAMNDVAEALNSAEACISEAEHDPTLRSRDTILSTCRALDSQMRSRVGRVTLNVPSPAPAGLTVRVNGTTVNEAFYGIPYIVNPGSVVVEAGDTAGDTFRQQITVASGAEQPVAIRLVASASGHGSASTVASTSGATPTTEHTESASSTSSPSPVTASAAPSETRPTPVATTETQPAPVASAPPPASSSESSAHAGGGIRPLPVAVTAVGVLGLGASIVFYVLRNGAVSNLEGMCYGPDHTSCPPNAMSAYGDAVTWNTATNVALIAGGIVTAAGAAWLIASVVMGGSSHAEHARLQFAPLAGGAWVGLGGAM